MGETNSYDDFGNTTVQLQFTITLSLSVTEIRTKSYQKFFYNCIHSTDSQDELIYNVENHISKFQDYLF